MHLYDEGVDVAELDDSLNEGERLYMITFPGEVDCLYAIREDGQPMEDFETKVRLAMWVRRGTRVRYDLTDVTGTEGWAFLVWDYLTTDAPSYICDDVEDAIRVAYPEAFSDDARIDDPTYADAVRWVRDEAPHDETIDADASGLRVYCLHRNGETEPLNTTAPYGGDLGRATDLRA